MDNILNSLHNYKAKFIICGNVNINYLGTNVKKKQLDNLLTTYNLTGAVYFPTRIADNTITFLDNIFVDNARKCTIQPHINGLSDHDAQLVTLHNFSLPINNINSSYIRNINKNTIDEFQFQLSWKRWDNVFGNDNVNNMFNYIWLNQLSNTTNLWCIDVYSNQKITRCSTHGDGKSRKLIIQYIIIR